MTPSPSVIDYVHAQNIHTLQGAISTLSIVFYSDTPRSLLDVGCGAGTWLRAAMALGVPCVVGIDGIIVGENERRVPAEVIEQRDLTALFNLGRRFDMTLCLEVAEHLPERSAAGLISSIASHSDTILFSAACPGQDGQHHINCQWPSYWQSLFNANGFTCDDSIRWLIWDHQLIEPWYRQNIFLARRDMPNAGKEPRLKAAIHPEMLQAISNLAARDAIAHVQGGDYPIRWYLRVPIQAAVAKVRRRIASWCNWLAARRRRNRGSM